MREAVGTPEEARFWKNIKLKLTLRSMERFRERAIRDCDALIVFLESGRTYPLSKFYFISGVNIK